jgi:hypothetical protein
VPPPNKNCYFGGVFLIFNLPGVKKTIGKEFLSIKCLPNVTLAKRAGSA